jgi:hypothetical protein
VGAISEAFDTLLRAHPVLAGQLEPAADGRHQLVADEYGHAGIWLGGDQLPDQSVALVNLRVKAGDDRSEVALYAHMRWQMRTISSRCWRSCSATPIWSMFPAVFVYELPPSRRNQDGDTPLPVRVPGAELRFSRQETKDLLDLCGARRVSLNALLVAAILLAEWRLRGTPHIPIPYVYPVDLRYFLTPPVGATESTNPLGMATYLAEIDANTDVVGLARYRQDVPD